MFRRLSSKGLAIGLSVLAGTLIVSDAEAHDGALPQWSLSSSCDANANAVTCRLLERIARYRIRQSWSSIALNSRITCVRDARSTSWRDLSECLTDQDDKAQIVCNARVEENQCRLQLERAMKNYDADQSAAMNELIAERNEARTKNRRLRQRLQKLFKVRDNYLDLAVKRQRSNDTLSKDYKSYQSDSRLEISSLKQATQTSRARQLALEEDIEDLQARLKTEQARRVELDDEIARLKSLLQRDRETLSANAKKHETLRIQNDNLRITISRLNVDRNRFRVLSDERLDQFEVLEEEREAANKNAKAQEIEITRLRRLLNSSRGQLSDTLKDRDALAAKQKALRSRQVRLIASRDEYQASSTRHRNTIAVHLKTIETLRSARERDADEIADRNDAIARLRKLLKSERSNSTGLLGVQTGLQNKNRGLRQRVARLIKARNTYQDAAQNRRAELRDIEVSYKQAQQEIVRLKRELQTSADDTISLRAQCDRRVAACKVEHTQKLTAAANACEQEFADITRRGVILFPSSSSTIKASSFDTLNQLVDAIDKCRDFTVVVEGHTDSSGNEADNLTLSQDRAKSVVQYLTREGVGRRQLEFVGYGQTRPIAENETPAGRQQNRRIQFTVKR